MKRKQFPASTAIGGPEDAIVLAATTRGKKLKAGKMAYGDLAGKWRDVIPVERRSKVAGID